MGQSTSFNRFMRMRERVKSSLSILRECKGTHQSYLDARKRLQETKDYMRLTIAQKEYLRGMEEMAMDELYRHYLVFTYIVDDVRLAINSPEYKAAVNYQTLDSSTGAHAWLPDLALFF